MITDEMVEAACVAAWDKTVWDSTSAVSKINLRARVRSVLEHYEAVRPKMVEVGKVEWDSDGYITGILKRELPPGTKLYAERRPPDSETFIDSFGATTA